MCRMLKAWPTKTEWAFLMLLYSPESVQITPIDLLVCVRLALPDGLINTS